MAKFTYESDNREDVSESFCARPTENYVIQIPKNSKSASLRKTDAEDMDMYYFMDSQIARPTRDLKMKFKQLREDDDVPPTDGTTAEKDADASGSKTGDSERPEGRYVPPAKRGARDGDIKSLEQQQKEECTVRVTNLSEDVKEADLTDLFGKVGKIHRIYLAKHKETKFSKGFAFITYTNRGDAAKAIDKLNRHGYDNLLLNVEWAKPSNRER
eukprot:GHVQ01018555.1.p1 GENE.GHVQ01018555.1~~GHVQ01018555.1.p1  ORF type:complete len:214 (+),score=38.45 GHVQ01018555.1:205-846(+)